MTLGEVIKDCRTNLNITREELADVIDQLELMDLSFKGRL